VGQEQVPVMAVCCCLTAAGAIQYSNMLYMQLSAVIKQHVCSLTPHLQVLKLHQS
jgi:hypothetical protein